MVSTKFYSDYDEMEVFTSAWAEEGRIEAERLKQLEIAFLTAIQWNLLVGQNEFHEKLKTVERLLAMKEGLSRGWYTYTELEMLLPTLEVAKQILNYTTILMFSYACSIATIALSSLILASIPPPTDLSTSSSGSSNFTLQANLLPNVMISTDDRTFDESLLESPNFSDLNKPSNFTINFPLFDRIMQWEMKKNYQDITNFQLTNKKYDTMPFHW